MNIQKKKERKFVSRFRSDSLSLEVVASYGKNDLIEENQDHPEKN